LEKLINENRKKYYLESLDDAIKKYRFMKTTSLPFMIENYLQGYFTILDSQFVIDRKNKRRARSQLCKIY
jgi:DNA phosphorothioation-dependent restriction protein DptG